MFVFGNLTDVAQGLWHYFDNIRSQYHHQEQSNSETLRTQKTKCIEVGANQELYFSYFVDSVMGRFMRRTLSGL